MTITPFIQQKLSQVWPGGFTDYQPVTFVFDPIPAGMLVTGTINFTVASSYAFLGQAGYYPPPTDIIRDYYWTLYRNGFAEYTWTGNGMLCNFQAWGNDTISIIGYPPSGANLTLFPSVGAASNPQNVMCNWRGSVGMKQEVPIVVPFLSSTVSVEPGAGSNGPVLGAAGLLTASVTSTIAGSSSTLVVAPNTPGQTAPAIQLWSATLSAACNAATSANGSFVLIDAQGVIYSKIDLASQSGGPNSTTANPDLKGIVLSGDQFPLTYNCTANAISFLASCTVVYSQVTALMSSITI